MNIYLYTFLSVVIASVLYFYFKLMRKYGS